MPIDTDARSNAGADTIINGFMKDYVSFIEVQIKAKDAMIKMLRKELESNPDNITAQQQIHLALKDMQNLVKSMLELRKDSDFLGDDSINAIRSEGICPDCGERKTNAVN